VGFWIGFVWLKMGFSGGLLLSMVINLPNQSIYSIAAPIRTAATPDKRAIGGTSDDTAAVLGKLVKEGSKKLAWNVWTA
jgi:hypothetical protein